MGLKPAELWDLTAREFSAFAAGFARREETAWKRTLWGAWHTGTIGRAKRIPDLKKLMSQVGGGPKRTPTADELVTKARALHAFFGTRKEAA